MINQVEISYILDFEDLFIIMLEMPLQCLNLYLRFYIDLSANYVEILYILHSLIAFF